METPIKVVNIKKSPYDIYIGRGGDWGNPYVIGIDGTREEVIAKYREYIMGNKDLFNRIPELKGKILGCHCKPSACHGDVLKALYYNYFNTELELQP